MATRVHFGTPHTFLDPIGSSTEGPSGKVRMAAPRPFRHTPRTVRGPTGSSTESPSGGVHVRPATIPAHHSHVSWPHRELHRRPKMAAFTCAHRTHFGTPLTRFVAP